MPVEKQICTCCGKEKTKSKDFYKSASLIVKKNENRMTICKDCVLDLYNYFLDSQKDIDVALFYLCRLLDVYYDTNLLASVKEQAKQMDSNICRIYFQKVNSLNQFSSKTFCNSTMTDINLDKKISENLAINDTEISSEDIRNKEDVIRMVGYDPFENENPLDKKYLYNLLVDFLDESTLEDSFKLPIVIEIVKSFNQIDKINQALATMTADVSNVSSQVGGVKSLIEAKKSMYSSILSMAKDNGISVNHNNEKSKGSNTLNGIVKKLNEIGLNEAEINLFDIETCEAMKQIADISHKSILSQLVLDENDYTDMISKQKDMIKSLDEKYMKLEEENRLLKIKIKQI